MKKLLLLLLLFATAIDATAQKVTALPPAGSLTGDELVSLVQSGLTKRATTAQIAGLFNLTPGYAISITGSVVRVDTFYVPTKAWVTNAVAAGLAAYIPTPLWVNMQGKPSSFPPSAHTHLPSDLLAGGATSGQVLIFNGTNWVPGTLSGSGGTTYSVGPGIIISGSTISVDSTKFVSIKRLRDSTAALRAIIASGGGGGGLDSNWNGGFTNPNSIPRGPGFVITESRFFALLDSTRIARNWDSSTGGSTGGGGGGGGGGSTGGGSAYGTTGLVAYFSADSGRVDNTATPVRTIKIPNLAHRGDSLHLTGTPGEDGPIFVAATSGSPNYFSFHNNLMVLDSLKMPANTHAFTVMIVGRQGAGSSNGRIIEYASSLFSPIPGEFYIQGPAPGSMDLMGVLAGNGSPSAIGTYRHLVSGIDVEDLFFDRIDYDYTAAAGDEITCYHNGILNSVVANVSPPPPDYPSTDAVLRNLPLYLGGQPGTSGFSGDFVFFEILIWDHILTPTETTSVNNGIKAKTQAFSSTY